MKVIHIGVHFGNYNNVLFLENLIKSILKYNTRKNVKLTILDSSKNIRIENWLKEVEKYNLFKNFNNKNDFSVQIGLKKFSYNKIEHDENGYFFVPYMKSFIDFFFNKSLDDDYLIFLPEDCQLICDLTMLDTVIRYSEEKLENNIISMLNLTKYRYRKKNNKCDKILKVNENIYLHKCKIVKGDLFSLISKELLNKLNKFDYPMPKINHAHYVTEQYTDQCIKNNINRYYLNLSPFILFENKRHPFYLQLLKKISAATNDQILLDKIKIFDNRPRKNSEENILFKSKWKYQYLLNKIKLFFKFII